MSYKLALKVAKTPNPDAVLAAKQMHPSKRMLRRIFGATHPRHKMAILLPGSEATSVEVRVTDIAEDDLTAVAEATGVISEGGDRS